MSSMTMSSLRQMRAMTSVDGGAGEGLDEVGLAGARCPGHGQVLGSADPFQGAQRLLGGRRDGRVASSPGLEGLAGGEVGGLAALSAGGGIAAGGFCFEQDTCCRKSVNHADGVMIPSAAAST